MPLPWEEPLAPQPSPLVEATPPGVAAPAQAALPSEAPPQLVGPPQQNMAFRIPVLGSILDTGRDLLVGPGNENLTTQEQITRAILNTIVLAKAPQALGSVYGTNQQRDASALAQLGHPQFRDRVGELMNPAYGYNLDEAAAIKQAAREYNIDTGIALPTSLAGLPPSDLATSLQYGQRKQTLQDIADIATSPVPKVSTDVSDAQVQAALKRRALGLQPAVGDAAIFASLEQQAKDRVGNPDQPVYDPATGKYVSRVTGLPVPETPARPQVAPGSESPVPGAPPAVAPPGMSTSPTVPNPTRTTEDGRPVEIDPDPHVLSPSEIRYYAEKDIPDFETRTEFNSATGKDEIVRVPITPEARRHQIDQNIVALQQFNSKLMDSFVKNKEELEKAANDTERMYLQIRMATDDLMDYVRIIDPETGKAVPRTDVFTLAKPIDWNSGKGLLTAIPHVVTQWGRSTWVGKMFAGNEGATMFLSRRGLAAQILARIITKDRVSEQDYETFAKTLPDMYTPRDLAEKMIRNIPTQFRLVLKNIQDRKNAAKKDLAEERRRGTAGPFQTDDVGRLAAPPAGGGESTPNPTPQVTPVPPDVQQGLEADGW